MATYTIYLFDDSCHLFTTTNLGLTYTISTTLVTQGGWSDLQMALNDGDAETAVAFDQEYAGNSFESAANITRNAGGLWTFINPTGPTSDGTAAHHQRFASGAVSGSAGVILALPSLWVDSTLSFPRISRDGGVTWSDITALGAGRFWNRAAINKGASIMYMTSSDRSVGGGPLFLSRSVDGGTTWADITAPPIIFSPSATQEDNSQLVCSASGTKVLFAANSDQFIYLSTNSGVTWSKIPPPVPAGTDQAGFATGGSGFASAGMSPDGTAMIVCFSDVLDDGNYPYQSYVATSVNSGVTWTFQTTPSLLAGGGTEFFAMKAAVSSDDLGFSVAFQNFPTNTLSNLDTVISGGSWQTNPITPVDLIGLTLTSMYMFSPPPSPAPPPVPFPGNPQTPTTPTNPQPNPSLSMRYSNDGGHTWSNYRPKGLV